MAELAMRFDGEVKLAQPTAKGNAEQRIPTTT